MVRSLYCNGSFWIIEGCWNVIRAVTMLETYKVIEEQPRLYLGTRDHFICLNFMVYIIVGSYRDQLEAERGNPESPIQGIIRELYYPLYSG